MPDSTAIQIYVQPDSLNSGLSTTFAFDEEIPNLRVSWIGWDSGFRGSGLKVGDRIVAIDGRAISRPKDLAELQANGSRMLGQYGEAVAWQQAGVQEDHEISLRIRRRRVPGTGWAELDVRGRLRLNRTYVNANNRQLFGPDGPDRMGYDEGSPTTWSFWYEERARTWGRLLDGYIESGTINNVYELSVHMEQQSRVCRLVQQYPGPFADAVQADFDAVRAALVGRAYALGPDALAYRKRGEELVREVGEAARSARAAFMAAHAGEFLPGFPEVDPVLGDRSGLVGRLVELPVVTAREWIAQGEQTFFVFQQGQYWCFADAQSSPMTRALRAARRYEASVAPDLRAEYAFIGRLRPEPALVVVSGRGQFGLWVDPVAVTIGGNCFVDVSVDSTEPAAFAGEAGLVDQGIALPPDDAEPAQVLTAFFDALKLGDAKLWRALLSEVEVFVPDRGTPRLNPMAQYRHDQTWTDARRRIMNDICAVMVVWTGDRRTVLDTHHFDGAPLVEEIDLEVDHLRQGEDGSHTVVTGIGLRRRWPLRQINGGPWRIGVAEAI